MTTKPTNVPTPRNGLIVGPMIPSVVAGQPDDDAPAPIEVPWEMLGCPLSEIGLQSAVIEYPDGRREPLPGLVVDEGQSVEDALNAFVMTCPKGTRIMVL